MTRPSPLKTALLIQPRGIEPVDLTPVTIDVNQGGSIASAIGAQPSVESAISSIRWLRTDTVLFIGRDTGEAATFSCCRQHSIALRGPTLMFALDQDAVRPDFGRVTYPPPGRQMLTQVSDVPLNWPDAMLRSNVFLPNIADGSDELRPILEPLVNLDAEEEDDSFIEGMLDTLLSLGGEGGAFSLDPATGRVEKLAASGYNAGPNGASASPAHNARIEIGGSEGYTVGVNFPALVDVLAGVMGSYGDALVSQRDRAPAELLLRHITFAHALLDHMTDFLRIPENAAVYDQLNAHGRKASDLIEWQDNLRASFGPSN